MKFKLQLVTELECGESKTVADIFTIERGELCAENLGLKLDEAKQILEVIQRTIVQKQVENFEKTQKQCLQCSSFKKSKGFYPLTFRSLFCNVRLDCQRLFHCACSELEAKSFSPLSELLPQHSAPELVYMETKWSSLVSFEMAAMLLKDLLPVNSTTNAVTVRNHTHAVAQRLEQEMGDEEAMFASGCPMEWAELPHPDGPITVGIDGTYVREWADKKKQFEIIIGKSIPDDGQAKCFGFVQSFDKKPKRRLFDVLTGQGMQMNQQIIFLSDGGEDVRSLQLYMNPQAEHVLDWFHITMRLTVLKNCATGIKSMNKKVGEEALKYVNSAKWYLWHGNVYSALDAIENLNDCLSPEQCDEDENDIWSKSQKPKLAKIQGYVEEFQVYIQRNAHCLVNYGERYHAGERISTGFTESAVNYVVNKRFSKRQQMQWSKSGAHLLLQTRTQVLNGQLEKTFERWYPGAQAA